MNDIILVSDHLPSVDRLAAVMESARRNLRPATWHALEMDAGARRRWCEATGTSPALPIAPGTVATLLRAESTAGKSVATVKRRAATLAKLHKLAGLPNPCQDELVRLELRGIANERGTDQHQAAGLTKDDVHKIAGRLAADEKPDRKDLRDVALMLVGRDLLARASELVSITVDAITWQDETALVAMRRGKTSTETETYFVGPDAAAALRVWIEAAGITAGPVWRTVNKAGRVGECAIGARDFSRALRDQAKRARIGTSFSGHSLRVGMAQDLTADNFEAAGIMQAAGWTTPRMLARYTRKLAAGQGVVAKYHAKHK
jgi:site-specific recombinase XerD